MSSTPEPEDLDIERDIPTTPEDVEALRRSRGRANLLPHLDRLTRAVRSLGLRPSRSTSEGWEPFELE